jgi:hypothetical protein
MSEYKEYFEILSRHQQLAEEMIQDIEDNVEDHLVSTGWADSWQELEEKFPTSFPVDLLPDTVLNTRIVQYALKDARDSLRSGSPYLASGSMLVLCRELYRLSKKSFERTVRKQQSRMANRIKKERKEKLFIDAMDNAKRLAKENPSWNNVQIAEEIMKDKTFKALNPRILKKRVLETFPDRNHRQSRK